MLRLGLIVMLGVAPKIAIAGDADQLVAQGEQLARQGRLTDAIEAFKSADRIEPRARHSCLIALAYIRRELWPQAEVFLSACRDRVDQRDRLPDWIDLAERELRDRLAKSAVAAVVIRVSPPHADAKITISSFAPDEQFAPRTIHLPVGTHLITATATGRRPVRAELTIIDKTAREVVLDFEGPERIILVNGQPTAGVPGGSRSHAVPWTITATGAAIALAGAAYHIFAFKPTRDALAAAADDPDPAEYLRLEKEFDSRRRNTIVLYGIGGALAITGLVLNATVYRARRESIRLTMSPLAGGGVVGLAWQR